MTANWNATLTHDPLRTMADSASVKRYASRIPQQNRKSPNRNWNVTIIQKVSGFSKAIHPGKTAHPRGLSYTVGKRRMVPVRRLRRHSVKPSIRY